MKKKIGMVVVFAFLTASAFALSVGGGLLFDYSANNGLETNIAGNDLYTGIRNTSFGGFVFFDATFVEGDLILAYGSLTETVKISGVSASVPFGSALQLGVAVLGKYPFSLGPVTLFPLVGFSYNMVLSAKNDSGVAFSDAGNLSQFGLQGGVGVDYNLTDSLFIRAEGIFQVRFPSKLFDDYWVGVNKTWGIGPVIKVALGYKL